MLLDYDVPVKQEKMAGRLKAVSWPKGFYVRGFRPAGEGTTKGLVVSALTTRRITRGTEAKYFNAVTFFDYVNSTQELESRWGGVPSQPPPGTT